MAKRKTTARSLAKARGGKKEVSAGFPAGYASLLTGIKTRVRAAQLRSAVSVNRGLILLYWDIGRIIVGAQKVRGYGRQVVEWLADDLQREFPGVAGFSALNLWRRRAFFSACRAPVGILSQPVTESAGAPPGVVASLPWGHNLVPLHKLGASAERLWYAQKAVEYGWSHAVLTHHIETELHKRGGKAAANFKRTLPPAQSDLAGQVLKDPCNFDFLTLHKDAHERDLDQGLLDHIQKFLIELGVAHWPSKLVESLLVNLKGSLPTVAEIEAEIGGKAS
jgi:predicted nuclease of restriction endonuclease-like (RecB) superfamily